MLRIQKMHKGDAGCFYVFWHPVPDWKCAKTERIPLLRLFLGILLSQLEKKNNFRREATSIHADYFVRPSVHMCHCLRTLSSLNLSLMEIHFRHFHRRHFITSYLKLSFGCHICRIVRSFGEFIFSFSYFNRFLEMLFVHLWF